MKLNKLKKLVCFILIFSMMVIVPNNIDAAQKTGWNVYADGKNDRLLDKKLLKSCTIEVEAGRTVYLDTCFVAGDMSKVKYKSSKKSVATVNKKTGIVKTKKKGTTTITATYKGKSYKCTLKVLKKGKLKSTTTYKNLNKTADSLAKDYMKKVTSKNFNALAVKSYAYGVNYTNKLYCGYVMTKKANQLAVPSTLKADEVMMNVYSYAEKREPVMKGKIKFVSATPKVGESSFKATINKKPTLTDIYMINMVSGISDAKKMPKTAAVLGDIFTLITVVDEEADYTYTETGDFLYSRCVLTPESDQVEVKLYTDRNCKKPYVIKEGDKFSLKLSVWTDYRIEVVATN